MKTIRVNKEKLFQALAQGKLRGMPDAQFLKLQFALRMHDELDLENPQTFNEKLQWLKLYDRQPLYTQLVDKYAVREYVAAKIGTEYLVPIYGVYESYEAIDFEALPEQFVLKANHTSGGVFVIKDKNQIDHAVLKREVEKWLAFNYYWTHREWPYKNVPPKMVAEKYMVDAGSNDLKDYKFFCFDGEPKLMYVASERAQETRFDFYDLDFNHLPVVQQGTRNSQKTIAKPQNFEKMIELARVLAAGIPHVRVDFYEIEGHVYFGEMTFYHMAGNEPFDPPTFDEKLGALIQLPRH